MGSLYGEFLLLVIEEALKGNGFTFWASNCAIFIYELKMAELLPPNVNGRVASPRSEPIDFNL